MGPDSLLMKYLNPLGLLLVAPGLEHSEEAPRCGMSHEAVPLFSNHPGTKSSNLFIRVKWELPTPEDPKVDSNIL